jgi:hypothetical protein
VSRALAVSVVEKYRAANLQAALVILAEIRQFPPESLAYQWAREVVKADEEANAWRLTA